MNRTVEEIKADIKQKTNQYFESDQTPEKWSEHCDENDDLLLELLRTTTAHIPQSRLETICAAEREGRVVVMPCKAGGEVFKIDRFYCEACSKFHPRILGSAFCLDMLSLIGKTVFLTRAEAEAALGGKQG